MTSKKIKIAYIINSIKNNGPSNIVVSLIESFQNEHYEPILITLFDENDKAIIRKIKERNIQVCGLRFKNRIIAAIRGPKVISTLVNKLGIDIIHTHGFMPDLISSRLHTEAKKVSTVHNVMQEDYKNTYGTIKGRAYTIAHRRALMAVDRIVGCSRTVSSMLMEND